MSDELPTTQSHHPTSLPIFLSTNLPIYHPTNLPIYHPTNLPIYPSPKSKRRVFTDSPLTIPGRAPLVEPRPPACRTSQLRPGCPVAPTGYRLWLLPSGPDQVHRPAPHRTQPSTLLSPAVPATVKPSEWEFSPAIADCEYRAPLAPRLARPRILYIRWGGVARIKEPALDTPTL
jgi:hypothetical protein